MSVFAKFKEFITGDEYYDEEYFEEEETPAYSSGRNGRSPIVDETAQLAREKIFDERPHRREREEYPKNVVKLPSVERVKEITARFNIVVIEPTSFDDCPRLVDSLKSKRPVILNLANIDTSTARKIYDFMNGATYALQGDVQKIAKNIFVFLPENVSVSNADEPSSKIDFGAGSNPWML